MKLTEVGINNYKSATILNEGWQDLTEAQQVYLGRWERELWPLLEEYVRIFEADLTSSQIQSVFTSAEQVAAGQKTGIGKAASAAGAALKLPIDIAKKVDAKINELGRLAQKAGPVKNADAKFEKLKKDIAANNPDSKIVQGVQKVSDWAKENPNKASIAVGVLTAIAAFVGGPAGGAAAGLILRSTNELLKGESLSTAIGKSVKTAAYGAIAGWALNGIGNWLEGIRADAVPFERAPGLTQLDVGFTKTFEVPGFSSVKDLGSMIIPEDKVGQFQALVDAMTDATAATGSTTDPAAINAFNELWNFTKSFDTGAFIRDMNIANNIAKEIAQNNDAFLNNLKTANDAIAAVAQGTITGKMDSKDIKVGSNDMEDLEKSAEGNKNNESITQEDVRALYDSLTMEQKLELHLREGPMDFLKKGAAFAKQKIKNVTDQVTADKLNSSWKKSGQPTDAGSIANILDQAGLTDEQIAAVAKEVGVNLPSPTGAERSGTVDIQSLADQIKKAGPEVTSAVKAALA